MKVLFVYAGMHPAHEPFVEAVKADVYPAYHKDVNGFVKFVEGLKMAREYPDYDVYILEGGMPMFPMYLRKKLFRKNGFVVGLLADETFINLVERQPHYSTAETLIHRISAKVLDAAIAVSPFVKEYAEKIIDVPIEVVRPAIPKDSYEKLGKVKPNLESNVIVSVGQPRFSIGMDVLVEQFRIAKKQIPELELWIVGKGHPKEYERVEGVKVLGYVEDLSEVFEEASLFVHAGRCSAYPVATLEAMRAGLPVVVSTMTGTKEIVERVEEQVKREFGLNYDGNKFIQPLNRIFEGIVEYFKLDSEVRRIMSELYKKESEEFEPGKRGREFKEKFEELVKI
ncbi:glycosyl transferase group 1 [Ferroglobus placidus DSM 10642]|uniref:Glycosyl transferase group 1 n=1 Tax=Ferroglobus placidus (strain DSM 10642 / AEDII12DO) TaxID=589924 RepID=D3S227_FERPA|nr:glycosyltransferase family 4 protein [Ferroglobus placidus]ADC66518.1 glycosyl transferase group 1 [Ferroglobus placidus DSM 10642]